ncbi:MAG: hypothetical protein R2710_20245 [Acidimicrobiales bacterium]
MASLGAALEHLGDTGHLLYVALIQCGNGVDEGRTPVALVEVGHADHEIAEVDRAEGGAVGHRDRGGLQFVHQPQDRTLVALVAQGAIGRLCTTGVPPLDRRIDGDELAEGLLDEAFGRWDRTVEHHRPHRLGVEGRIDPPDLGAVAEAEVGQRVVANRSTHHVEVVDHRDRPDVVHDGAGRNAGHDPVPHDPIGGDFVIEPIVAVDQHRGLVADLVVATETRGVLDATRVERHDVEALTQFHRDERCERLDRLGPLATRSTEVHEDRSDPFLG